MVCISCFVVLVTRLVMCASFSCLPPACPLRLVPQAFELGAQELHLESWGDNAAKLRSVAFDLAGIDPQRVVVGGRVWRPGFEPEAEGRGLISLKFGPWVYRPGLRPYDQLKQSFDD